MLETSSRLLEVLSLLQARREWSGADLADRLEVGPRTIRRDMERLRRLGYPVHATPGVAGGYRLGAGASLPPLLLDEEEAVAVAVALGTAASGGVAGIEETAVRALAKLEHLLPARVRRRVGALGAATVPYPSTGPTVDPSALAAIAASCRDSERLRLRYRAHDGTATRRLVEPHRLVHTGGGGPLVADAADRADGRPFRVDRSEPPVATERRFVPRPPPADDVATYVAQSVSATRDRWQARIVLHVPIERVRGRIPTTVGTLEAIDERSCLLRTGSGRLGRPARPHPRVRGDLGGG